MEHVFNEEHGIVIVEIDDHEDLDRFMVYVEGEWVGTAFELPEAREMAEEVLIAITGEEQSEEPE